ncbi:hypothetical protein BC830DRAFT_1170156 [Chytriomyces sp. MP71]|nr:hypothetical protein BC830DRAFT_1170156 [Chytriomyces sp. MP71]
MPGPVKTSALSRVLGGVAAASLIAGAIASLRQSSLARLHSHLQHHHNDSPPDALDAVTAKNGIVDQGHPGGSATPHPVQHHQQQPTTAEYADESLARFERMRTEWMQTASLLTSDHPDFAPILHGEANAFSEPVCVLNPQLFKRYSPIKAGSQKVHVAINLALATSQWDHLALPNLGSQLTRLTGWLGPARVSYEIVTSAGADVVQSSEVKDKLIVALRDHLETVSEGAAVPFVSKSEPNSEATHLLTLSSTVFCLFDVLEMIHQHLLNEADHTCGVVFQWDGDMMMYGYKGGMAPNPHPYMDAWRDLFGNKIYPETSSDNWSKGIFHGDEDAMDRFESGLPLQILSCSTSSASLQRLPAAPALPVASCPDNTALHARPRTLLAVTAKFAIPMAPEAVRAIRVKMEGEPETPLQAYGVAKRDAHPPAIRREMWRTSTQRIDGVVEGEGMPGYVQGVWKQEVRDRIEFADIGPDFKVVC